jgi:hypothetical protein
VPLADKNTDRKQQGGELALQRSDEIRALPLVCSGELEALIPLWLEGLGPLREPLAIELPVRLDGTDHMPVLAAAELQQAVGSISALAEDIDLELRGQLAF